MLKHQSQINENTCTSACLAMILDISIWTVFQEFHAEYCSGTMSVSDYLDKKRCAYTILNSIDTIKEDGIYLAVVASLNTVGGLHQIVMEVMDGNITIYDPNKGRVGMKYYSNDVDDMTSVRLTQYILDLKIGGVSL